MILLLGPVPEDVFVLQRQVQILHRVKEAHKAAAPLDIVVLEDPGDFPVAFLIQILHQHAPASDIVVKHGERVRQLLVIAVHEDERDALFHQLLVEPDVGIGQAGLRPLDQDAVELLHPQQGQEDTPLAVKLVLRGEK